MIRNTQLNYSKTYILNEKQDFKIWNEYLNPWFSDEAGKRYMEYLKKYTETIYKNMKPVKRKE